MLRGALLAIFLSLTAACATLRGNPEWFPVEPGMRWTYRLTQQIDDQPPQVTELTIAGRSTEIHAGERFAVRRGDSATDYLFLASTDSVIRAGRRRPGEREPRWDPVPHAVLRLPLREGDQWQRATGLVLLPERALPGSDGGFELTTTVVDTDTVVDVPAGRFDGSARLRADAIVDWAQGPDAPAIQIITDEWYVDGIGLVKLVREERDVAEDGRHGRLMLELTKVERDEPPQTGD